LVAVVAAPLFEEFIFRGIILDGYLKNYKPMPAIVVSALLFGIIHGNLVQGIGAFVLGLVFGWLYWGTRSIVPAIFLHFVNNGIAFISTLFIESEDQLTNSLRNEIHNDTIYFLLYAVSVFVAAFIVWFLNTRLFYPSRSTEDAVEGPTT